MLASSLFTLITTLALASTTSAQQTIGAEDGSTYTCPDVLTVEVAYASYCPATSVTGEILLGTSSIGHFENSPDNYNQSPGGFRLICSYPEGDAQINCAYSAGGGQPLTLQGEQAQNCPQAGAANPQASPGPNWRRALKKRYDTNTRFTCPRTSDAGLYLEYNQVSNGNRGGNTGYLYDCVWLSPDVETDVRCTYDVTGTNIVYNNQGTDICPQTLCDVVGDGNGEENTVAMRRGIFSEAAQEYKKRQVKAGSLRRRQNTLKAIKRGIAQ